MSATPDVEPEPETDTDTQSGTDPVTGLDAEPDSGSAQDLDDAPVPTAKRRRRLFTRKSAAQPAVPEYEVRICRLEDLDAFEDSTYVHPEIVRSWLALQQFGEVTLLVMWYRRTIPAGQVLISWTGDWDDEIRKELPGVPALCNLHVEDDHRGHGLARQLITAAEKLARGTGYARLTMGVDQDSTDMQKYGALGYHDSDLRTESAYTYKDADGKKRTATEHVAALVKSLNEQLPTEDTAEAGPIKSEDDPDDEAAGAAQTPAATDDEPASSVSAKVAEADE